MSPPSPDSPQIREAKRAAARTGMIAGVVIFGVVLVGDVFLLISDVRHGRGLSLPLISAAIAVAALMSITVRWIRRPARDRDSSELSAEEPRSPGSDPE